VVGDRLAGAAPELDVDHHRRGAARRGIPVRSDQRGRRGHLDARRWKVWHYILAGIFFLGALWGFIRPVNTFFALASVLGLILIFYGSFEIVQGMASRVVNPYWWLKLITGILLILLAFWVSGSDRVYALAQRTYLILFWVGFLALFRGFTQIMLAFAVHHAGREAAAGDPAAPR